MFIDPEEESDIVSNLKSCICLVLQLVIIYFLYWVFFIPLDRVRQLEEVGWNHLRHKRLWKQKIQMSRSLRKSGKYPRPFPNGWFVLAESRDVGVADVQQVDALGKNFAVYRGKSGKVFVTDAYCPHMGANLCSGGRVENDCIKCPFHSWAFNGESGECESVPYSNSNIPKNAKLKTYLSLEQNNLIYVWHHNQDEEPTWFPELIDEINNKSWIYQGRSEYYVNCHIQEIPENGADSPHLNSVHFTGIVGGGEPGKLKEYFTQFFSTHAWEAGWEPTDRAHISRVRLCHSMKLFNKIQLFNLKLEAFQIGPASVHLHFNSMLGRGVMIQSILPVKPLVQKLVHTFYTERTWLPPYGKLVLLGESIHLERDIRVWNSKVFLGSPVLVKEDAPILKFRRWYSQFYTDNHIKSIELDW